MEVHLQCNLWSAWSLTLHAVIILMIFAIASDTLKMRSPFIGAGLLLCLVGFAINISDAAIAQSVNAKDTGALVSGDEWYSGTLKFHCSPDSSLCTFAVCAVLYFYLLLI